MCHHLAFGVCGGDVFDAGQTSLVCACSNGGHACTQSGLTSHRFLIPLLFLPPPPAMNSSSGDSHATAYKGAPYFCEGGGFLPMISADRRCRSMHVLSSRDAHIPSVIPEARNALTSLRLNLLKTGRHACVSVPIIWRSACPQDSGSQTVGSSRLQGQGRVPT